MRPERAEAGGAAERRSSRAADEYALHIDVESLYRQHMTEADRRVLLAVTPGRGNLDALASPELEAAVFGTLAGATEPPVGVSAGDAISPFLAFAVAVHRTAVALESATFVEERVGPGRRIPVFDVAALSAMVKDPLRRYFFIELLASYTRVSSGVAWRRTARGWKRHRFSELDPARLAGLLDVVTPEERAGIYRRLGDCSLFLLGVFPDHPPPWWAPPPTASCGTAASGGTTSPTPRAPRCSNAWAPRGTGRRCTWPPRPGTLQPARWPSPVRSQTTSPTPGACSTPSRTATSSHCAGGGSPRSAPARPPPCRAT